MFITMKSAARCCCAALIISIIGSASLVRSEPCAAGAYTSWLSTYVSAVHARPTPLSETDLASLKQLATAQPCSATTSDDDYLTWFALWTTEMRASIDRYRNAIDDQMRKSVPTHARQAIVSEPLTLAEAHLLSALAMVRPTTGVRGYAAWCKPFSTFVTSTYAAETGHAVSAASEADGILNDAETALLSVYAAAAPAVAGDGTLPMFLDMYLPLLQRVATSTTPATIGQRTFLEIVGKVAPPSTSEADFLAWFTLFDSMLAAETEGGGTLRAFQSDNRDLARIFLQAVRPINAGGDDAYKAWFAAFTRRLKLAISGAEPAVNLHEAEVLNLMNSVRPCGRAEAQASYARIASMRDSWIRAGGAVLGGILDHAAPTPCKAP